MLQYFLPTIHFISFILFVFLSNITIDYFMVRSSIGPSYRLLLAPGIIIHELSHALVAKLCGCRITKFNITAPEGGYVVHTLPRYRIFQVAISLAPIIGLSLSLFLITHLLAPSLLQPFSTNNHITYKNIFSSLNADWQTLVFLILAVSFSGSLAPSKQDIKVTLPGLIYLTVLLIILSFTPLGSIINLLFRSLYTPAYIIAIFLLISIILSYILYITAPLFKHPFKKTNNH